MSDEISNSAAATAATTEEAVRVNISVDVAQGTAQRPGLGSLPSQCLVEVGRLLRRWSREPAVITSTVAFPILLLLLYDLVLGKSLGTGDDATDPIYGFVPMIAVAGAMYGAMGTGESLFGERESGLLRRFWVLPIHRAAALIGRLLAECVRAAAATLVVLVVGVALGLRFEQGWAGALGMLIVPIIVIAGFTPVVVMVGVSKAGGQAVQLFAIVVLVGMFFNSGFVPVHNYPSWLQPIVRGQPMSCAIETMRNFALGGPLVVPLLQTVAWAVGMTVVFGALAVRGYRKAAEA